MSFTKFRMRMVAAVAVATAILSTTTLTHSQEQIAILIGVKNYQPQTGFDKLLFTDHDLFEMAYFFKNRQNYGSVSVLTDAKIPPEFATKRPSRQNIVAEVAKKCAAATADDTLLIYFSGHGVNASVNGGKAEAHVCPIDTQFSNNQYQNMVPLSFLKEEMKKSKAKQKFLIVDACRDSGNSKGVSQQFSIDTGDEAEQVDADVIVLSSCRTGESSFESEELKHGYFTCFLLAALKGRQLPYKGSDEIEISPESVISSIIDVVPSLVQNEVNKKQTPFSNKNALIKNGKESQLNIPISKLVKNGQDRCLYSGISTPPPNFKDNATDIFDDKDQSGEVFRDVTFCGNFEGFNFKRCEFRNCVFLNCKFDSSTGVFAARFIDCEWVGNRTNFSEIESERIFVTGVSYFEGNMPFAAGREPIGFSKKLIRQ